MVYIIKKHHNLQFPARLSDYFFIQSFYYSFTVVLLFNTGSLFFCRYLFIWRFPGQVTETNIGIKSDNKRAILEQIKSIQHANLSCRYGFIRIFLSLTKLQTFFSHY